MLEIFINNLAIFTNDCESGECDWMLVRHARSVPFVCIRPHWVRRLLAPLTGRIDVLGGGSCFFVGNLVIGLFIGYSLLGVAEVASKFDALYHSAGFGQLVFHHFVHDV